MHTYVLIIMMFAGSDGGRAVHETQGFTRASCEAAVAQINTTPIPGSWRPVAVCVNKEPAE